MMFLKETGNVIVTDDIVMVVYRLTNLLTIVNRKELSPNLFMVELTLGKILYINIDGNHLF